LHAHVALAAALQLRVLQQQQEVRVGRDQPPLLLKLACGGPCVLRWARLRRARRVERPSRAGWHGGGGEQGGED
jgi:hypothetical protein